MTFILNKKYKKGDILENSETFIDTHLVMAAFQNKDEIRIFLDKIAHHTVFNDVDNFILKTTFPVYLIQNLIDKKPF